MSDLLELLEIIESMEQVIEHQQKVIKQLAEENEMLKGGNEDGTNSNLYDRTTGSVNLNDTHNTGS